MTFIDGENIVSARDDEIPLDMTEVSLFLAKFTPLLHNLQPTKNSHDELVGWLETRFKKCLRHHWKWRSLPAHLISEIESYLPSDPRDLIDFTKILSIHGDLTDENVIGEVVEEKAIVGKAKRKLNKIHNVKSATTFKWKPKHLIDFGDSRHCDILYELVSLHFSVFECDKNLLKIYLQNYIITTNNNNNDITSSLWDYYFPNGDKNLHKQKFVKKLMCYTLLHECDATRTAIRHVPSALQAKNLDELADIFWDLS